MKRFLLCVTVLVSFTVSSGAGQAQSDAAGITVTGVGEAAAPAESVAVEFILADIDAFMGMPSVPDVEATPGAAAAAAVGPIVEALEALEGVDDVVAAYPPVSGPYGPSAAARLLLSVTSPSASQMLDVVTTAAQAASRQDMVVLHAGALFSVADCESLEREALSVSLAEAERLAAIQADVMGVAVGDIVSAATDPYYFGSTPNSGCDPVIPGSFFAVDPMLGATLPMFDPTRIEPEVTVSRTVRVTFAIAESLATPAS